MWVLTRRGVSVANVQRLLQTADPIIEKLDPLHALITYRLFREATRYHDGKLVKVSLFSALTNPYVNATARTCPTSTVICRAW
jgi:TFIIF-interacting CTD phosphatase-like protein